MKRQIMAQGEAPAEPKSRELTPKQRKFLELVIEGYSKTEAYKLAYNTKKMSERAIGVEAIRLAKHPTIALAIAEATTEAVQNAKLTREWVIDQLMQNVAHARSLADVSASNKALELLGKVDDLSLFVERSKSESDNRHHLSTQPVSRFHALLERAVGAGAEEQPAPPVPN